MTDGNSLEQFYQENLEEQIILRLADIKNIPLDEAMRLYYGSELADQISRGENGI